MARKAVSQEASQATSNAAINATIKSIKSTGKKFRELVQLGIEQCIAHAKDYGDCTGAARLVDAIPQEVRRVEVIRHFAEFSPIRISSPGRGKPMKASLRKPEDENYVDWNLEGVKAHPWWEREGIMNADNREVEAFNLGAAEERVINIANLFERKASAPNTIIEDPETGAQTRRENMVNDDRDKVRAMAMMLRMVGNDPWEAANRLGLPKDYLDALKGVKPDLETSDPAEEDTGEEARNAA